ncbi:MAG: DUF5908 family protein [Bacteroidales bacterium]|nr:DUF5908 family protein [Bacteroidales bacterium]
MAVEINEIVIKAILSDEDLPGDKPSDTEISMNDIVQECVNRVVKVLTKKNSR